MSISTNASYKDGDPSRIFKKENNMITPVRIVGDDVSWYRRGPKL